MADIIVPKTRVVAFRQRRTHPGTNLPAPSSAVLRRRDDRVVLLVDGAAVLDLDYRGADDLARNAGRAAFTAAEAGDSVLLLVDGRVVLHMSARGCRGLALSATRKARRAEEQAKAQQIALDAAILLRSGAPFGLTSDPKIRAEAKKEAAWNGDLRRYMPGGVRGTVLFGAPRVGPPARKEKPQ